MTAQDIALRLLKLIGVTSLDPAANLSTALNRGLEAGDLDEAAEAITSAIQEIFALGPVALSEQPFEGLLRAPAAVSLSVEQYSTTISALFGFDADWMPGCTVRLDGDPLDNELVSASALRRPYTGATGEVTGTVYGDAIQLPEWVKNVMEPVRIPRVWALRSATTQEEFRGVMSPHQYGNDNRGAAYYTDHNKSIGEPAVFWLESRYDTAASALKLFLRVNPMPGEVYPISCRAKRKPPVITAANIGSHLSEPLTVIPTDWHESILVPIAKHRFTAHPAFNNEPARAAIAEQYRVAKLALESFTPQITEAEAHYS